MRISLRALLICLLLAAAVPSTASQMPDPPPGTPPAQVQQMFDAMLVMQAPQVLGLSEPQYAQFLTRLKVLQDIRRQHQQQRVRLISELQRMTNPRNARGESASVSDTDIQERLTALQELDTRTAAETRRAYQAVDEVLDVRQRARFRVFEEQIERRKLELIARARQPNRPANPSRQNPPRRPPKR
jgi:hypothetical protein